ncbi:unnamed protein product, partial [Mesorhabditis spiculigera]
MDYIRLKDDKKFGPLFGDAKISLNCWHAKDSTRKCQGTDKCLHLLFNMKPGATDRQLGLRACVPTQDEKWGNGYQNEKVISRPEFVSILNGAEPSVDCENVKDSTKKCSGTNKCIHMHIDSKTPEATVEQLEVRTCATGIWLEKWAPGYGSIPLPKGRVPALLLLTCLLGFRLDTVAADCYQCAQGLQLLQQVMALAGTPAFPPEFTNGVQESTDCATTLEVHRKLLEQWENKVEGQKGDNWAIWMQACEGDRCDKLSVDELKKAAVVKG